MAAHEKPTKGDIGHSHATHTNSEADLCGRNRIFVFSETQKPYAPCGPASEEPERCGEPRETAPEAAARHFHSLEQRAGDVADGMAAAAEAEDQHRGM